MATILVIDDRPINREFLVSLLDYAGHETHAAGDGLEGLALARETAPDLVITDVLMPTMDGVEFTRQLKTVPLLTDVPVIFYTATYRLPEAREIAESCGVSAVLAKPSEPQTILDAVHGELGMAADLPGALPVQVAATGRPGAVPTDRLLTATMSELNGLQQQIHDTLERDDTPSAKAQQLRAISSHLDESLKHAQALSMRLAALIELGLDLASQTELGPLLDMFCHASQDIMSARIAAVCVVDEHGAMFDFVIRGVPSGQAEEIRRHLDPASGLMPWFADLGEPQRFTRGNGTMPEMPRGHPPVTNLVAAPLTSADRNLGWFYVADKLGGDFNDEDEQLATTLVSQLLPEYENALLVDRLRRHAGLLEFEGRRIERLSRIQTVLSGINSAIVRIRERGALLEEAARIAVEHGGFVVAWIGLVQPGTMRIELIACNGVERRVADALSNALFDETAAGEGFATQALRSKTHFVLNDLNEARDPGRALRLALGHGLTSAIALPLMPDARPGGVIVLFANETDFFDAKEIRLLDELAGDISFALEYISREERLHHLAYYDSLTDLPNTRLFHEHLAKALERPSEAKSALFLIDIDRFTQLNDTLGRHVGDQLLTSVAERLKSRLPSRGSVARIGSDTFAVAMPALNDESATGSILQDRIFAAFADPFDLDGRELRVSARVGVAVAPEDGESPDTLFKNAEAALKEAKDSGARYLFYSADLNARIAEDLALEQELIDAVANREFEVYYQPKVDSASGEIVGFEALLRWNSPRRGLVSPADFIPALESSELILDVGRWVLQQALSDRKTWEIAGLRPLPIAVNVSPLQLRYDDFPAMVLTMLEEQGAPGRSLELEITESLIMADIEASIERLEALSKAGVAIAVDDFGTGYSSLRYLALLPLQALKIDRSFIVSMTDDASSMTLVSTIIGLAHAFRLSVIAEGVDSEEQAKFLRLMKCDVMQGYLFGKPQPAREIEKLLRPASA